MQNPQSLQFNLALGPQASATTARTASLDCAAADYVSVLVPVSAEANTNSTNVTITVAHSDTDVATNYANVTTALLDNTAAISSVVHINWKDKKRYCKVTATPDATTNGAVLVGGIYIIKQVEVAPVTVSTSSRVVVV